MPPQQSSVVPRRRSIETISIWALIATVVVSAFAFIPSTTVPLSTTKAFVLATGALITLALFILARLSRGNIIVPPFALIGALWLPVVAYALSATLSGIPFANALWGSSLETDTFGFMVVVAALGTLAALMLRRSEHYRAFLRACAIAFSVLAILQVILLVVGRYSSSTISPGFSLAGSMNDLGLLMGLGVVGVLITFRFLELPQRAYRILAVSSVAALFLIALANSALVWILLALVSLGLFVESVMKRGPRSADADIDDAITLSDVTVETDEGNSSIIPPLAVLAVSLFFLIGGTLGNALAGALNVNVLNVRPSWQSTLAVGQKTYATNPAFGSGPGTFGVEWLKYRDASLNSTAFWNVDFTSGIGFIPTSFVTTGIVGAIAWVAFFVLFAFFGVRMLILRAPEDAFIRYVAILSFVGALYLFAVAIFDLPNGLILALLFVFMGLFVSTMRFAARGAQWGVIFSRSPRLGFVIVFGLTLVLLGSVVAAYMLVGRYIATVQFASASTSLAAGNLDEADKAAQSAISFAPNASAYKIQAGIAFTRLGRIASSQTMPPAEAQRAFQDALTAGINAGLTATRLSPSDYQNWLVLGNLYAQAVPLGVPGAYESAKSAYEKARAQNPTNPQIPYIMAQLDAAHRDVKGAISNIKEAIALKQDYPAAIFFLSQLEVQDGNVEDALTSALAAAYFQPNDPNVLFQVGILYAAQNDFANAQAALEAAVAANPQFANARYFLSAVYVKRGDFENALTQMQAVAGMSAENATAVATQLTALTAGKNPFPANLLSITPAP